MEQQAKHDPRKDLRPDAGLPALDIRKRQRQHDHHQRRERISQLVPQRDLVTQGALVVFLEMLCVRVQAHR